MPESELTIEVSKEFCSSSLIFVSIDLTQFKFHYFDSAKQASFLVSVNIKGHCTETPTSPMLKLVFPSCVVTLFPR